MVDRQNIYAAAVHANLLASFDGHMLCGSLAQPDPSLRALGSGCTRLVVWVCP